MRSSGAMVRERERERKRDAEEERETAFRTIDTLRGKGKRRDELNKEVQEQMRPFEQNSFMDTVSHFTLRLAYCKTWGFPFLLIRLEGAQNGHREENRRWFLEQECLLFK